MTKPSPANHFSAGTELLAKKRLEEGLNAMRSFKVGRGKDTKIVEVEDIDTRIRCALAILDRNLGRPAQTVNVNKPEDDGKRPKSPGELLADLQGNLPLLQKVLANFTDAMNTINVTPEPAQIGKGPDGESGGSGHKSPKNGEK